MPVSDVKTILSNLHNTMALLNNNISNNNEIIKLTYDVLNNNETLHPQIKNVINENNDDMKTLNLIKRQMNYGLKNLR